MVLRWNYGNNRAYGWTIVDLRCHVKRNDRLHWSKRGVAASPRHLNRCPIVLVFFSYCIIKSFRKRVFIFFAFAFLAQICLQFLVWRTFFLILCRQSVQKVPIHWNVLWYFDAAGALTGTVAERVSSSWILSHRVEEYFRKLFFKRSYLYSMFNGCEVRCICRELEKLFRT